MIGPYGENRKRALILEAVGVAIIIGFLIVVILGIEFP